MKTKKKMMKNVNYHCLVTFCVASPKDSQWSYAEVFLVLRLVKPYNKSEARIAYGRDYKC